MIPTRREVTATVLSLGACAVFAIVAGAATRELQVETSAAEKPPTRFVRLTQQHDGKPIWFRAKAVQTIRGDSENGSLVTVQDGWRYGVMEDVATVIAAVDIGLSDESSKPRYVHFTTADDTQPITINTEAIDVVRTYFGGTCQLATRDSRSHVVIESSGAVMTAIDRAFREPGDPEPDGL